MTAGTADLQLAGIDGCRAGWVAALAPSDLSHVTLVVFDTLNEFAAAQETVEHAAIDMPVNLPVGRPTDEGLRRCDESARKQLGWPRSSSVFAAPPSGVLKAADYEQACQTAEQASGRRISVQAWNLVPKIREVQELLTSDSRWRDRLFETHPELCFARLNGGEGVAASKKTPEGRAARLRLLASVLGRGVVDRALRTAKGAKGVANDDKIDAMAALLAAFRRSRGEHRCLPNNAEASEPKIVF